MPVFKNESNGTWYVMARYVNWKGERKQKCKRGFSTKKEAQEWERMFQLQNSSDMDMSFEAFTELYIRDIVFARPYSGREKDLKIEDADSIFAYSIIPEKDIAKLFKIIELDKSQISVVGDLVDTRNDMAHASGKFEILTEESFDVKVSSIFTSMNTIHRCMNKPIRKWYEQVLLSFCAGEYEGYDEPKDIIFEQMIQSFKLSTNELLICNEMSVSSLITAHRGYQTKLKEFKKVVSEYCQELGYI